MTRKPVPFPLIILGGVLLIPLCLASDAWSSPDASLPDEPDVKVEPAEIAITIDDLPSHGEAVPGTPPLMVASQLIAALKGADSPPVYGFSNGEPIEWAPTNRAVLSLWHDAGFLLGNHTYRHVDLGMVSVEDFLADVERMDAELAPWIHKQQGRKLFRYPYLSEGNTPDKRERVRQYLDAHGYRIAPVTVDFNDWAWNAAYLQCAKEGNDDAIEWLRTRVVRAAYYRLAYAQQLARLLLGRDIKHILLLHMGAFTGRTLPDILTAFKAKGVRLISLDAALSDPIYDVDPHQLVQRDTTFLMQLKALYHVDAAHLDPLYDAARLDHGEMACLRVAMPPEGVGQ